MNIRFCILTLLLIKCWNILHTTVYEFLFLFLLLLLFHYWPIGIMVRVFANGPGDQCSISRWVKKWFLLYTRLYKVWIKSKWSNSGKGVSLSPTPQCSNCCKGNLRVTLDYSWPIYKFVKMLSFLSFKSWSNKIGQQTITLKSNLIENKNKRAIFWCLSSYFLCSFSEMPTNNFVESSFWNFDALFQPQQHPARDAHDTFFISGQSLPLILDEN